MDQSSCTNMNKHHNRYINHHWLVSEIRVLMKKDSRGKGKAIMVAHSM